MKMISYTQLTYQDFESSSDKASFCLSAVNTYKTTDMYNWALEGDAYYKQLNTTINKYRKLLYTVTGEAKVDHFSANHKCASNFFNIFVTQEVQYLLGNGITFTDENTKKKLGKDFDVKMQKAGKVARSQGVSYVFFNKNKIEVFKPLEFVPLFDEVDGSLKAGIRFWQIAPNKPMRMTLYELDGYTDYIYNTKSKVEQVTNKKSYIQIVKSSVADGTQIYNGYNYPNFPIIPFWGDDTQQSALVGMKEGIDCYDLIKSGFANDLDDASLIYWTLTNCGGMDEDEDLIKFIEHMKTVKAAVVSSDEGGAKIESHTIDIPYESRQVYLDRLESDLYRDAMALNTKELASSNLTATAIRASYEPLDGKTDDFEYKVLEVIDGLLALLGIDDTATFKRNRLINQQEETNMVLSAKDYLDKKTLIKHLPFLTSDEIDELIENIDKNDIINIEVE